MAKKKGNGKKGTPSKAKKAQAAKQVAKRTANRAAAKAKAQSSQSNSNKGKSGGGGSRGGNNQSKSSGGGNNQQQQQNKGRQQQRQQRAEDFRKQKVQNVKDFNFNQHGDGHVSQQEANFVRKSEGTLREKYQTLQAQQEGGAKMSKRATGIMGSMKARLDARAKKREEQKEQDPVEEITEEQVVEEQEEDKKVEEKKPTNPTNPTNNYAPPNPTYDPTNPWKTDNSSTTDPFGNNQNANNTGDIGQETDITNTQEQNVNQDNDITTNINGNNNTVHNQQDNSIRQYGGDNRSLVINNANTGNQSGGGWGNSADQAITMGTLSGFYAPDDSPAAQASFVDQHQTMNRDAQKHYKFAGARIADMYSGFRGGNVDIQGLQKRIDGLGNYFQDMATVQEVKTYGDRAAVKNRPDYELGEPLEEIKANTEEIANQHKDDIDDV